VLGTPEDPFWNSYEEPFESLLTRSVDRRMDLNYSAETGSAWALPLIGGFEAAATTPSLGLLGNPVEYGSYLYYLILLTYYI